MVIKSPYTDNVNWEEVQAALRERMGNLKRGEKGALADKLGVSSAVLSQLISGYRPITRERAEDILKALDGRMNYQPEFPGTPERES